MAYLLQFLVCAGVLLCCHGEDTAASQLLLFEEVPENINSGGPHHLIIRNNFKGSVEFIESENFHIEVNITSPSNDELATIHYNYTNFEGSILLQLFQVPAVVHKSPMKLIFMTIGAASLVALGLSIIFVCWWNVKKKPYVQNKVINPDSVQAPLLDAAQASTQQNKLRKRKKQSGNGSNGHHGTEGYSSEEDPTAMASTRTNAAYSSPKKEPPAYGTVNRRPGEDDALGSSQGSTPRDSMNRSFDSEKPVVSFIKMDSTDGKSRKKNGHYIPLRTSDDDGPCCDLDRQATLKIRDSAVHPAATLPRATDPTYRPQGGMDPTYDSIRRQRANPQMMGEIQQGNPQMMGDSQYRTNGRYVPLKDADEPASAPYVPSPAPREEYSTINKALSGAQIAHILSDKNKGSPKSSYGQDRPPVTFSAPPLTRGDHGDLEHVDLDSVGSSRSAGSSRTSGTGTQSYSESVRSEGERRMLYTDSDSARSSGSAGAGTRGGPKYHLQGSHSPLSSADSCESPGCGGRLVDEAYGTMGSNGGATLRSCSTASTGSGSSGSVITVINNDDTLGKRVRFNKAAPQGYPPSQTYTPPGTGQRGGGGRPGTNMYLHSNIIMCLSLLCVLGGVYSAMVNETEVHIKIYAPSTFLKRHAEVYMRADKTVDITTRFAAHSLSVVRYEVADTYHRNLSHNRCLDAGCENAQGCDANTGRCLCKDGYYLKGKECVDVDECASDPHPCDPAATCYNIGGSYRCICDEGYYGDGHHCQACDAPCGNGTFEVMPCSTQPQQHPKLCKDCMDSCMDGYYISAPCTPKTNTQCRSCVDKCKRGFFEVRPCVATLNRDCKDIDSLPKAKLSQNLIYEDRRNVQQVLSYILHQDESSGPLTHMMSLKRGTGFVIHVTLKESNLAPLFRAVNHHDSHDNEGFFGDPGITQEYCPYPVPEKYELSLILHQGMTTKAEYYSCGRQKKGEGEKCVGETGYYLNPREPCNTYSQFGRLPTLNKAGWSVLCTRPGLLSDVFGVSSQLTDLTTMFVDKTVKCAEQRTNCDSCTRTCARNMQGYRGIHRCNITGEDADNGESPRLQYCYSCCNKEDCSRLCEVYHNAECEQLRCVTGNLAEVVLSPKFSQRTTIFGCHIEPVPNYKIYDLEFTVLYNSKRVNQRSLKARKLFEGHHPDKAIDQHHFLKVFYGSDVRAVPNLVEGETSLKSFSAGYYQAKGVPVSKVEGGINRVMSVRPKMPFSVSSNTWKRESCDTKSLEELIQTTNNMPDSDPYRPDPHIKVQYVTRSQYRLFNNTETHLPFIYFEIPRGESVLKPMYDATSVKDDDTLKAELTREPRTFMLKIQGELEKCPGYFEIKVYDPLYPSDPLYFYDVGVDCPKTFNLQFAIPVEGADVYDKRMMADIKDSYRTIHLTVLRPKPEPTMEAVDIQKDTPVDYENQGEEKLTVFSPLVAVLCVLISFLLLLLVCGFITDSGKALKKTDNKVHSQHLLFVVCYVTFRTAYSLAVTFTVLVLLIRYVNRDSMSSLGEFSRYVESAENNQKIEIEQIQQFVLGELERQNKLANQTKVTCEKKLLHLQSILEDTKQQMKVENQEERLVSHVVLQYTKIMVENFTQNIEKFKREFSAYAETALERLTRSIVQTSSALQENKWLAGAEVIHEVVKARRAAGGQQTRPLMDWVGIRQEVDRLQADLSLNDFPMPNISKFLNVDVPKVNAKHSSIPKISDITLPRNQWYYQYETKAGGGSVGGGVSRGGSGPAGRRVTGADIISWTALIAALVVMDAVWFVHRMARTYSTAKMVLYGCPSYVDCKRLAGGGSSPERSGPKPPSVSSRCLHFVRDLNLRVMKTELVPKLVATVTAGCGVYLTLAVADRLLTVNTLASVGYFDSLVAPVETSYNLAKTRIKTNAYRINKYEYPFYESLVNVRTKRYQLMLEMYADLQKSNSLLHDSEYCAWKQKLSPGEPCNCTSSRAPKLSFGGCELPPVAPKPYHRKDFGSYRGSLARAAVPYLNAARRAVSHACHLVVVFVAVLVLVDALGNVVWIYFKRFNLLRLKPMYEIEQFPPPEANHT